MLLQCLFILIKKEPKNKNKNNAHNRMNMFSEALFIYTGNSSFLCNRCMSETQSTFFPIINIKLLYILQNMKLLYFFLYISYRIRNYYISHRYQSNNKVRTYYISHRYQTNNKVRICYRLY